jgi:RNA polymerase sigma-70 factor, ECF subfamily
VARRFRVIRGGVKPGESTDSVSSQKPPFEQALLAHIDRLFAFALRLERGQRERAEDLVQETSLQAFRNYESLRSADQVKPWLFRILINTRINTFHSERRIPALVDVDITPELLARARGTRAETPEEDFFKQLLSDEVQEALDALPWEFRTVVWLADIEEMSYREIAEIIGCPHGTVASRLYRGHSLLGERLRDYARRRGLTKE